MAHIAYKNVELIKVFLIVVFLSKVSSKFISNPVIFSAEVLNVTNVKNVLTQEYHKDILIELRGINFDKGMEIILTPNSADKDSECVVNSESKYKLMEVWTNRHTAHVLLNIPMGSDIFGGQMFMCIKESEVSKSTFRFSGEVIKWIHQGDTVKLTIDNYPNKPPMSHSSTRRRRDGSPSTPSDVSVRGMRVEKANKHYELGEDGIPRLLAYTTATIRLFGQGFTKTTQVTFTSKTESNCEFPITDFFPVIEDSIIDNSALIEIRVPPVGLYYVCIKDPSVVGVADHWNHQGTDNWLAFRSYEKFLPLWLSIVIILTCLLFSALFSGLNLGLMSLDKTDLLIVSNTGSEDEKRYARAIMPVRKTGNYLLCSILLGNVLVNSTLTILFDDLTSGVVAVIVSTFSIVIFGEICPQAICSRYGLAVGAKTIYVTKMVMFLTFPLSYPISKLLDLILGVELGNVYTRERLKVLINMATADNVLEKDEVNVISGALELRRKTVKEVMTKLEDAFMLNYDSILDFETVSDIIKQGFSRIPVFEGERTNIITMLFIKDLAFVDPDDSTPLKTLCKFYQNSCNFVFEDTTLDIMFRQFKEGIKGHMAFVHRVNSEGEGDPFYETTGLITLEDVIEELIQSEIVDETDVWTDNRSKRKRNNKISKQDFTIFAERRENQNIHISPQLTLATFQYLHATVDAFKPEIISETILRRLLKQDIIYQVKVKNKEKSDTIIYTQGKAVDYFVLVLEGRVEVVVGKENLRFESGPFTYFGTQALAPTLGTVDSPITPTTQNMGSLQSVNMESMGRHTFVPDYTVRAITEVFYVRIKRSLYLAAKRATLMEQSKKESQSSDHFDDEVEKLLHSLEEEGNSPTLSHKDPSHQLSQNDKNALQRCIEAAERGGGLTGNDMTLLQSLSCNNAMSRSPSHVIIGLDNELCSPSHILSISSEPNGSVKSISPLSINKIIDKNRKVSCAETDDQGDVHEERTTLLPTS